MIDSLGDVGATLNAAKPGPAADLYEAVGLRVTYSPEENAADVSIHPGGRVNSACVRGRSCTLTTRLYLSA